LKRQARNYQTNELLTELKERPSVNWQRAF